jgi:hydrogenase maturation protease
MSTAVLGLGNPLLTDDGVGLVLLDSVRSAGPWDAEVELVDGGTWGLALLPVLADHSRLLVLDAVRAGADPGTVLRGGGGDIPRLYRFPPSPHQIDLTEVLGAAELLGVVPEHVEVVGVQPGSVDGPCLSLTPTVAAAVPRALGEALAVLAAWGHTPAAAPVSVRQ